MAMAMLKAAGTTNGAIAASELGRELGLDGACAPSWLGEGSAFGAGGPVCDVAEGDEDEDEDDEFGDDADDEGDDASGDGEEELEDEEEEFFDEDGEGDDSDDDFDDEEEDEEL
jgi:hypothetical protein